MEARAFLGKTVGGFKLMTNLGELTVTTKNPWLLMNAQFPTRMMLYPKTKRSGKIFTLQVARKLSYQPNINPGEFLIYADYMGYDPSTQTAELVVYQRNADAFSIHVQVKKESVEKLKPRLPLLVHGRIENLFLVMDSFKVAEKQRPLGSYPQLKTKKRFKRDNILQEINDPVGQRVRKRVTS